MKIDTFLRQKASLKILNGAYAMPKAMPKRIEYKNAVDC
jgi:hypothetical protein